MTTEIILKWLITATPVQDLSTFLTKVITCRICHRFTPVSAKPFFNIEIPSTK